MEFDVEVRCRQRAFYRVEAADAEAAERAALERWQRGEPGDLDGVAACELEAARVQEVPDQRCQAQDDEVALRFIRERERLVADLGGQPLSGAANDAVAAGQLAADLGWSRREGPAGWVADVLRAGQALERLRKKKRLVCFARPRGRAGEQGDIRLYCTPEYLEKLSAAVAAATNIAL
jgi:hypothetical protein